MNNSIKSKSVTLTAYNGLYKAKVSLDITHEHSIHSPGKGFIIVVSFIILLLVIGFIIFAVKKWGSPDEENVEKKTLMGDTKD